MRRREIHGDDLLYRFFNEVLPSEPKLFEHIPHLLVISLSVWFPKSVYQEMPVLLPWVVRDPTCRGKSGGDGVVIRPDRWGAPNSEGYLRDDNSMVKGIPRSLAISSSAYPFVNGKHLGKEFVASHIWRENETGVLASRLPLLNTFVPNLVWLPSQVSKLSDREDGAFQAALKEISWGLFRNTPLKPKASAIAEMCWAMLPKPQQILNLIDSEFNWFISTPRFMRTRRSKLTSVINALELLATGKSPPRTLQPSRYREGLSKVAAHKRESLHADLMLHDHGSKIEIDKD